MSTVFSWRPSPEDYRVNRENAPALVRRLTEKFFLILVPAGLLAIALHPSGENYAFDFEVFWKAGGSFLDGTSPYPEHSAAIIAMKQNFLYPAPIAALFAPLSFIPFSVAAALFSVIVLGAAAATLYVLGVRDWRCYGAVALGFPLIFSVGLGTISTLLALSLAALWRWRNRTVVAALLLAFLVLSKLFLWPLALWFLATRRYRAVALAVAISSIASLLAWWRVGFETLGSYPHLLRLVADVEQGDSFSPTAMAMALGLDSSVARIGALVIGLAAFAFAVMQRRTRLTDFQFLVVALGVALVCSPIVWGHYLILLFVPIAIARPRLSPLWFATAWMTPDNLQYGYNYGFEAGGAIATALGLVVIATILSRTGQGATRTTVSLPAPARVVPAVVPPARA